MGALELHDKHCHRDICIYAMLCLTLQQALVDFTWGGRWIPLLGAKAQEWRGSKQEWSREGVTERGEVKGCLQDSRVWTLQGGSLSPDGPPDHQTASSG